MTSQEVLARGVSIQEKKILLAYFRKEDYFFLPGGHVESGESVLLALEREIDEEINIKAQAHNVLSVFEHSWNDNGRLVHELNFLINFSCPQDTKPISQVGHLDFVWLDAHEFKGVRFLPEELRPSIESLLAGKDISFFQSSLRN